VLTTPCANRDAQNGFRRGLSVHQGSGETINDLHVALGAVRNSFGPLHRYLNRLLL
jgi:hypothetical protein